MRVYALYVLVAGLSVYAWKDWFKSLCGLILLLAVIEHEDMPKSIVGIQGLNLWNVLMMSVVLAWAAHRRREGLQWDMPRHVNLLLGAYLVIILVGFVRMMADRSHLDHYTPTALVSEELFNTLKWVIPGLLLFDGCRTRVRLNWALFCLLAMYLLLALQVARRIPPSSVLEVSESLTRIRLKLCMSIGYSACDMSTILGGASWAMVAAVTVFRKRLHRAAMLAAAGLAMYAQALTGGRAGFAAWGATGLAMCLFRWQRYLLLLPVLVLIVAMVFPGAAARALEGFDETDVAGQETVDTYAMTSGRMLIWPHVVDKIAGAPALGYGRLAMNRTGLATQLMRDYNESFPHPHNVYLEWLLDNGIIGFIPVAAFFGMVIIYSVSLFRDSSDPSYVAVGGCALALVVAQLVAGIGAQHFYPRESTLGMWAAIFLMLRVHVERQRAVSRVLQYAVARAPLIPGGLIPAGVR